MECTCQMQPQGTRISVGKTCNKDEVESIQLIQNKLSCAAQAARPDAIPDGVSEAKARVFIQAALDSLASYRWLENDWWNMMKEKYDLPRDKNVWIDFQTGEFYLIEE